MKEIRLIEAIKHLKEKIEVLNDKGNTNFSNYEALKSELKEYKRELEDNYNNIDHKQADFEAKNNKLIKYTRDIEKSLNERINGLKLKHGKDGKDGIDGKNGIDGKDGYTPIKDKDYFDGKDGYTPIKNIDYRDGKDGVGIKDAIVDNKGYLIITLTNGRRINCGLVKGKDGLNGSSARGIGIRNVNIANNHLIVTLTDGDQIDAGYIGGYEGTANYNDKEDIFRYSTMPTASEDNQDKIIEYIGNTTNDYTNGYFYKCNETIDTPAVQESLTITQGENTLLGNITYDINIFKSALQPSGTHTYYFNAVGYPSEITLSKYTDRFEFLTLTRDSVFDVPARLPIGGAMYSWVDGANNYYYSNTNIPNEDTIFYLSSDDISQPSNENSGWIYSSTTSRFTTGFAIWQIGSSDEKIELDEYGLYCVTSPMIGDTLQVTYTPATQEVSHYNWVQINVQPNKTKLSEFTNDVGFITQSLTKETSNLTNIMLSGSGTKQLTKYGDLVHLNFNIYVSSITANTLYTLGKIPNGYKPESTYYSSGIVYEAQSGNIVGTLKLEIKTNGDINVKTNASSSSMPVLSGQATWFINR